MDKTTKKTNQNPDLKKVISFRLTESQYEMFNFKLKKFGMNKSETFRLITKAVLNGKITETKLFTSKIK